jgi:SAM-dependent methyltransferase
MGNESPPTVIARAEGSGPLVNEASGKVDHYGATYEQFAARVYADVRARAFGEDIGQTGWLTAGEQDLFLSWLNLDRSHYLLDVACGSGGPTLRAARLTGCRVHGIEIHRDAVRTARSKAEHAALPEVATFQQLDAGEPLPFSDAMFDAVICVDAINHLPDRGQTLREWARILKPGGRVVFTDPIVVTGPLSSEEIAVRSSIGFFLFVPPGLDEELLVGAGFDLVEKEDRTRNMAGMARKWREAREARADDLRRIEGDETFDGQQRFFEVAAGLAEERRLSRFAFCARRV